MKAKRLVDLFDVFCSHISPREIRTKALRDNVGSDLLLFRRDVQGSDSGRASPFGVSRPKS